MIRVALCILLALSGEAAAAALPLPPTPPATPPLNEAAPVPDFTQRGPSAARDSVQVGVQVMRSERPDTSLAFTPGSRYQPYEERKPLQTPGIRITVPLQ